MRFLSTLSALLILSRVAFPLSLDTDVVIISNNDLDPSNLNRAGALLLRTPLVCSQAVLTCAALREVLLPPPTGSGFTSVSLTAVLASDRHGAALAPGSSVWIAGNCKPLSPPASVLKHSSAGCAIFTLGGLFPYNNTADPSSRFPALCTNSAPLTRSNVTSYDTTRQIDVSTPKAGILRGFRDKFTWRFLGVKYAASTASQGRFQPPTPLDVSSNALRTALAYGPFCAQVRFVDHAFRPVSKQFYSPPTSIMVMCFIPRKTVYL